MAVPLALVALGVAGASTLVVQGTLAAYAVPTDNPLNSLAAGTVTLTDDDGGSALFSVSAAEPGQAVSRCVTVSYGGTLPAASTLYAASPTGTLGPYLDLTIEEGVTSSAFSSCSGFSPTSLAYVGTLSGFAAAATSYATGVGSFAPPGAGQSRAFRLTATLQTDAPDSAQGASAGLTLRWQARNADHAAAQVAGLNIGGSLGVGDTTERLAFTSVNTEPTWSSVAGGNADACGIKAGGTLWCWGLNSQGLVDGTATARTSPTQVGAATDWARVSVGTYGACAIKTSGTLWCWGYNNLGQLGLGDTANRTAPTQVGSALWRTVSFGNTHTCGVQADGTLWCWGDGSSGRLGDGASTQRLVPTQAGAATGWSAVSVAVHHTCGIESGRAYCWGSGTTSNIGNGTGAISAVPSPTEVSGNATNWATILAGGSNTNKHACATRTDGTLWCWGANGGYQLGLGDTTARSVPTQVGSSTAWAGMGEGFPDSSKCALRRDRTLWCWGANAQGQFATGDKVAIQAPTQRATGIRRVSNGFYSTFTLGWPGP